ncbi:hypothetical protein EPYR_01877 [Erwinia pyrifoliae DSM 12163]|nr:hypothetical protein EPYR_01877 [Erwinia pyrifoliae DSM 12163]
MTAHVARVENRSTDFKSRKDLNSWLRMMGFKK